MITDEQVEAALKAWFETDAGNHASMYAALKAADLASSADALKAKDKRIAALKAALKEVHRRTGLLLTQNQGRWNMSVEHDRRTADVLSVNQDITRAALEGKDD